MSDMSIFSHHLSLWLAAYATQVPLLWFVFIGSILEEVVSPIPAMLITGIAGSLALVQREAWWYLLLLACCASLGKTLGAWLYYVVADKGADVLLGHVGKWFGVTNADVERVGARFTGQHWKDGGALFLTRVLPFMPSTPFSVAAGILNMNLRVYLSVTLGGYFLKDIGYVSVGYFGFAKISTLWRSIEPIKTVVDIVITIAIILFLYLLYRHRHRGKHAWRFLCRIFDNSK